MTTGERDFRHYWDALLTKIEQGNDEPEMWEHARAIFERYRMPLKAWLQAWGFTVYDVDRKKDIPSHGWVPRVLGSRKLSKARFDQLVALLIRRVEAEGVQVPYGVLGSLKKSASPAYRVPITNLLRQAIARRDVQLAGWCLDCLGNLVFFRQPGYSKVLDLYEELADNLRPLSEEIADDVDFHVKNKKVLLKD